MPQSGKDNMGGFFVKSLVKEFWYEEDGLQTVEIVLILVILLGLVVSLRNFATVWLETANDAVTAWLQELPLTP